MLKGLSGEFHKQLFTWQQDSVPLITMLQWFCALQETIGSSEVPLPSMNHCILANCPLRLLAA